MPLTDEGDVETIQEGEGGVTEGDIELLFEDADNVLKGAISDISKCRFQLSKLISRLSNLMEVLEWHHHGPMAQKSLALPGLGQEDARAGACAGPPIGDQFAVASRSPKASAQAKAPKAKKEKEA